MRVVQQSCTWLQPLPPNTLEIIERAGRVCYKSEDKITPTSAAEFVRRIMTSKHESVIEHVGASMHFVTDRGVTHEMVRHRIASYSQESTRYCNYSKGKFGGHVTYVLPVRFLPHVEFRDEGLPFMPNLNPMMARYGRWVAGMEAAEKVYKDDIADGASPQEARDFLPNSLKTEIVMTANVREWRHFFRLRTSTAAHPQMRALASEAYKMFCGGVEVLFEQL